MKHLYIILTAVVAGFFGGVLATRMGYSSAQEPKSVIRARGFEVVDERGQTISFWGVDQGQNVVLAFGSRGFAPGGARPRNSPPGLSNPDNQVAAIGLLGEDSPMLKMRGADGKLRLRMLLSTDAKPVLTMGDEKGPRVALGVEQSDTPGPEDNNWSLVFAHETARIGMGTEKKNGQTCVRGVFFVNPKRVKDE
jgi:hypothetical protein